MASLTPWPVRAEQGCTNHRRALAPRPPPPITSSTSNALATFTRIHMRVRECVCARTRVFASQRDSACLLRGLASGYTLLFHLSPLSAGLHFPLSESTRARQRGEVLRTAATSSEAKNTYRHVHARGQALKSIEGS